MIIYFDLLNLSNIMLIGLIYLIMIGAIGLSYFYHLYNTRYQRFLLKENIEALSKLDNSLENNTKNIYYINQPSTDIVTDIQEDSGNLKVNGTQVENMTNKIQIKDNKFGFLNMFFNKEEKKEKVFVKKIAQETIESYKLLYKLIVDNNYAKQHHILPIHTIGLSLALEHKLSIETKYQKNTFSHRNDVNLIFLSNLYLYQSIYKHHYSLKRAYLSAFLGGKYLHCGLGYLLDKISFNMDNFYISLLVKLFFCYIIIKFFFMNNHLELEFVLYKVFLNPIRYIRHSNPYKKLYKLV